MTGEEEGPRDVATIRGRGAIAASILGVLIIAGYFAASRGDLGSLPTGYLISALVLAVAFWFPAMRIGSLADLRGAWRPLTVWILAWTAVWDLATSGILGDREPLEEWWLVYPSGLLFFGALLALHAAIVRRVETPRRPDG